MSTPDWTDHADLFAAIGVTHGGGDLVNTFHLPDLRGRFLRGTDRAAGRDPDAGARGAAQTGANSGDAVGSVQDDEVVSHTHSYTRMVGNNAIDGVDSTTTNSGEHHLESGHNTLPYGGSNETRPKNVYVDFIIKI